MTREEALERLVDYFEYEDGLSADKDLQEAYKMARKALKAEPIKHGRWIATNKDSRGYSDTYECSNCNRLVQYAYFVKGIDYDYCPNCGAKMDEVDNG